MFAKVPIKNGELDIDYRHLKAGAAFSDTFAVVVLSDDAEIRPSWVILSDLEYLSFFQAGKVKVDRTTIKADGLDAATVTAEVHPDITEIIFYTDANEPIATVPVDPETHTATLQVTATTPGAIYIRAGRPSLIQLNEVVINATAT